MDSDKFNGNAPLHKAGAWVWSLNNRTIRAEGPTAPGGGATWGVLLEGRQGGWRINWDSFIRPPHYVSKAIFGSAELCKRYPREGR